MLCTSFIKKFFAGSLVAGAVIMSGCGEYDPLAEELAEQEWERAVFNENGGLRWGNRDDPSLFDSDLVYELDALPMEGAAARAPWTGNYWPTYQDNINFRWNGAASKSPADKYGEAFGVSNVADKVSRYRGIDGNTSRKECDANDVCDADLGEVCAKRRGATSGRCIPTWWGICHAWAPASILEPEPVRAVTHNNVEFKVNDIKALLSLAYDRVFSKFISLRCNENAANDEIEYDRYGRPTGSDTECRDTNPGTFHIIATNYLGLRQESFVYDRTFDHEVWNQPVRDFRVSRLEEVSATQANILIGATAEGGESYQHSGSVARAEWNHVGVYDVTPGTSIKVAMTGTNDADLYVRYSKAPTASGWDCRPYVGGSVETCELTVPDRVAQIYVSVVGYSDQSDYRLQIDIGGMTPNDYLFNADAAQLFHVEMAFRYISESSASTDGNLSAVIDRYTRTDSYAYVLEVDARGKIIGGEWIGDSKRRHPDFLWLPTGRRSDSVASGAIRYGNIKMLLDRSIGGGHNGGGEEISVNESGTVARNTWKHYGPFDVHSGELSAVLSGTNDADIYVRREAQPTASEWDCRPYIGGSDETCTVAGPGPVYVSVVGYAPTSNFALAVTYLGAAGSEPPPTPTTAHLDESGSVGIQGLAHFDIAVVAGRQVVVRTESAVDVDLYIQMNAPAGPSSYLKSSTSWTGSEQISFAPTSSGRLHIAVYGYQAGSYRLITADQ